MKKKSNLIWLTLVVAPLVVVIMTLAGKGALLAEREGLKLESQFVKDGVSLDPYAAAWESISTVALPLSAQTETVPRGGGATKSVKVKSLNDGKTIYFLLEWEDSTDNSTAIATHEFRDACAVQFPEKKDQYGQLCMGLKGSYLNVWHWMADWQQDQKKYQGMEDRYPNMSVNYYPVFDKELGENYVPGRKAGNLLSVSNRKSAVEELIAGGAGALTFNTVQNARGKGVWKDGTWKVVISRAFTTNGGHDTSFSNGLETAAAVAVWNGAETERSAVKSVSNWFSLTVGQ